MCMVYVNVNAIIITSVILVILGIVIFLFVRKIEKDYKEQQSRWIEDKTERVFPLLRCEGENILYLSKEIFEKNSITSELLFHVRTYDLDRQKEQNAWRFMANILKIKDSDIKGELFYYNNMIFKNMTPSQYQKSRKVANHYCYTLNGELTEKQENLVIKYNNFARKLAVIFCVVYAIYFHEGKVHIIFSDHFEHGRKTVSSEYIRTYVSRMLEEL